MRERYENWVFVDEMRPRLPAPMPIMDVKLEDISVEYVREMWWIGDYPFPSLEDLMNGLSEFRRRTGQQSDRIVIRSVASMFGVEVLVR